LWIIVIARWPCDLSVLEWYSFVLIWQDREKSAGEQEVRKKRNGIGRMLYRSRVASGGVSERVGELSMS
jgi:hypothetical protein